MNFGKKICGVSMRSSKRFSRIDIIVRWFTSDENNGRSFPKRQNQLTAVLSKDFVHYSPGEFLIQLNRYVK
jgi:hypothetical protein